MTNTARTWVFAVAGFLVAGALAFLGGRAVHDPGQATATLPPVDDPEPVVLLTPVDPDADFGALAVEASDQEIAAREIASGLEVTLDGAPGEHTSAGIAGGGDHLDESGEPAPVPDPIFIDPGDGPPSDAPAARDIAIDECADGGGDCPDGVGGTILLSIRAIPPLAGIAIFNPPTAPTSGYAWVPECPAIDVPAGGAYFAFSTTRPVVIEFDYRAYPWRAGGYLAEGELEFVTPDEAEAPWLAWIEDESAPADDPRSWIKHCVLIPDLPPSGDYVAFIWYRDKYDGSIRERNANRNVPFSVAGASGFVPGEQRRPTSLLGYGIDDLRIGLTQEPDQRVEAVAIPGGTPGDCATGGDEASILNGEGYLRSRVLSETEIPSAQLTDPTYPYWPHHSISKVLRIGLQEGTDYLVCIYWLASGSTFDRTVVEIAEEVQVSTPEAYRPRIRFHGVTELFGGIDRAQLDVQLCGSASIEITGFRAGDSQLLAEPVTICDAERDLTEMDRGIRTRTFVRDTFDESWLSAGRFLRTDLDCHGPCRLRLPDMALIPLPEVPTERRLCGTGFGSGCDGEIPMRSAGFAVVEIQYIDVPGNGLARWSIGEAAEFEDTRPEPVGDTPLIDVQMDYIIEGHPRDGGSANVRVVADRPVTVSVSFPDRPRCGIGRPTTYSSDALREVHTFRIDRLCLGNAQLIEVIAHDAAGTQATIVDFFGDQVGTRRTIVVPPLLAYLDISVTIPSPDSDHWHTAIVRPVTVMVPTVEPPYGTSLGWSWPVEDRAAATANGWQMFGLHGQANACGDPTARSLTVNGSNLSWGALLPQSEITLRLEIDLKRNHEASRVYSECAVDSLELTHVMQATMTLADLFDGVTITSDSGAVLTVRIVNYRRDLVGGS